MMTSLTNGFSLSSAGAHDEAKGQRGGSKWQSSVCRLLALGRCEKTLVRTCTVQAGGGGGRRVPPKDGKSFALISPAAFCSVYAQKEKKKRKKKVFFHLVGDPRECNFQALSLSFLSFLLPTPPQGRSGTCNTQVCSGPCLLSRLFHKAGWYSGFFQKKKKRREKEGDW